MDSFAAVWMVVGKESGSLEDDSSKILPREYKEKK